MGGRRVHFGLKHHYLALHKPAGYISSRSDPEGRPTVMELVPESLRKLVYPVGRLDYNSEGLLFLFDDGEFANQLIHPRYEVPKRYQALVAGNVGDSAVAKLRKGILLDDGMTAPAHVRVLDRLGTGNTVLEVTIHEGRKRQVRRMLEKVGHPVQRLMRVAIGGVELGNLPVGKYRDLTEAELALLRRAVSKSAPPQTPPHEPTVRDLARAAAESTPKPAGSAGPKARPKPKPRERK